MKVKEGKQLERKKSDVMEYKKVSADPRSSGARMVLKVVLRQTHTLPNIESEPP